MRILTSVCFTAALLPISGLSVLANPIDGSQSQGEAFLRIQKVEINPEYIAP